MLRFSCNKNQKFHILTPSHNLSTIGHGDRGVRPDQWIHGWSKDISWILWVSSVPCTLIESPVFTFGARVVRQVKGGFKQNASKKWYKWAIYVINAMTFSNKITEITTQEWHNTISSVPKRSQEHVLSEFESGFYLCACQISMYTNKHKKVQKYSAS